MPVTFSLAAHSANEVTHNAANAEELLRDIAPAVYEEDFVRLFSSSFGPGPQLPGQFAACKNGLIDTVLTAYNQHHALVLRPDDVWLAIMVQFSFFVNKNAEQLRGRFVAHEGKQKLKIEVTNRELYDGASLAPLFATELSKHVTDATLRGWIVPDFSTTTATDRVVGCATLMGAMKKYFSYEAYCMCGIPRITVEGQREDWEEILRRADKLSQYGDECVLWHRALVPVLQRFVATFDDPGLDKDETRKFWESMVQYNGRGSGIPHFTGWLSAFCAFDIDGNWLHAQVPTKPMLDGVSYPKVTTDKIPGGYVTVDIKLDDNGTKYDAVMLAGVAGQRVLSSGDQKLSQTGTHDSVAPAVSWFLYQQASDEEKAARGRRWGDL